MRGITCAVVVGVLVCALGAGCSGVPRGEAVPVALIDEAEVPGLPQARFPHDVTESSLLAYIAEMGGRRRASFGLGPKDPLPDAAYLALSGGGSDGAYGAGVLCAWTERGDRPEFVVVTGVSTGALIAPFAFLGPEYDSVLRETYTQTTDEDILKPRGVLRGVMSDAMADTAPLAKMIAREFGDREMQAVAREWQRGRWLLIATTNIDSGRPVIWDIGAIAASGHPGALELIRKVLLASAAIPGAFPPVMFDVEAGGKKYQEMHVDGGAAAQVFIYPAELQLAKLSEEMGVRVQRTVYVIRNSQLAPPPAATERKTMAIASRAISSLIRTQGVGDMYRIYLEAVRDGMEFHLTFIPAEFTDRPKSAFDPEYMQPLFELGYQRTKDGTVWDAAPPGFDGTRLAPVE